MGIFKEIVTSLTLRWRSSENMPSEAMPQYQELAFGVRREILSPEELIRRRDRNNDTIRKGESALRVDINREMHRALKPVSGDFWMSRMNKTLSFLRSYF